MEGEKDVRRRLLEMKKELKCWEAMFERKHGRKPNKDDVDQSPSEIKDTYREYQRLKGEGRGGGGRRSGGGEGGNGGKGEAESAALPPQTNREHTSVEKISRDTTFGAHLNKPIQAKKKDNLINGNRGKKKFRKWTKDGGYKTVVGGVSDNVTEWEQNAAIVAGVGDGKKIEEPESKPDTEEKDVNVDVELKKLSLKINMKISHQSPQKKQLSEEGEVPRILRGQRNNSVRPKMGQNLSSHWLQRCKPDLLSLSGTEGVRDVKSEVCDGAGDVDSCVGDGTSGATVTGLGGEELLEGEEMVEEQLEDVVEEEVVNEEVEEEGEEEDEEKSNEYEEKYKDVLEEELQEETEEEHEYTPQDFHESSSDEEEGGECGGWDGQLQDMTDENLFNPATRHGYGSQITRKSCDNFLILSSTQSTASNSTSSSIPMSTTTAETTSNREPQVANSVANSDKFKSENCDSETSISTSMDTMPYNPPVTKASNSGLRLLELNEAKMAAASTSSKKKENTGNRWKLQETKGTSTVRTLDHKSSVFATISSGNSSGLASEKKSGVKISKTKDSVVSGKAPSAPPNDRSSSSLSSSVAPVFMSNSVSDNFVRINLKVKRFSRKPGGISGSAYKRKMWKKAQRGREGGWGGGGRGGGGGGRGGGGRGGGGGGRGGGGRGGGSSACFKCGKPGHWAKNCTERQGSNNLGCFAGEKVNFSEVVDEEEKEMDREALQRLAKESPFPSTREAAMMARGVSLTESRGGGRRGMEIAEGGGTDSEPFRPLPPCRMSSPSPPAAMEPLFTTDQSTEVEEKMMMGLRKLGYQSFRAGQAEAISRIICGVSTLLIQPTGSGKSLCYQLPAYLYSSQRSSCITLVISPLVSLMEDQVRQFPACLKGACLHTNQTQAQRQRVMADIGEGRVDVLLLSPEALVSGVFWSGWARQSSQLPPVAFACIDEAHCVSEWSHNFRPSYLRVHKVLKERLGVQCVLGLTATATRTTALSVASHLSVSEENIISGSTIPSNLHITASADDNRDDALLQLLQSTRMRGCDSIIIYCTRQMETERVAQLIRTSLQFLPIPPNEPQHPDKDGDNEEEDENNTAITDNESSTSRGRKRTRVKGKTNQPGKRSKKAKLECSVESYHAGMSAGDRKRIQLAFMTGRLRIVVATVAFGMGLNKSDVRAIIHYNVPKSFESYVQEIGRAGRDGKPAYCHVFIDQQGSDLCELRRHAYSNTVDPYTVKHLVKKAFPSCSCSNETTPTDTDEDDSRAPLPLKSPERQCAGHEVSIPIETTVQSLDVKEECIQTLLCYLELQGWLEMKGTTKDSCILKCYGGPQQLRALSQKVPAVAAASARLVESGSCLDMQSSIIFSCIEVASSMGWESHILRSELRDLQFNDRGTGSNAKNSNSDSSVLVEFSNPSFHLLSPGDMTPGELDFICRHLQEKVKLQETLEVDKLHLLYSVLRSVAFPNIYEYFSNDEKTELVQQQLMKLVNDYFEDRLDCTTAGERGITILKLPLKLPAELEAEISCDVYSLMSTHAERNFSGRTIARIFHGIASPCFPAEVWAKQRRFWRRHLSVDFNTLCHIATRVTLDILHSQPNH